MACRTEREFERKTMFSLSWSLDKCVFSFRIFGKEGERFQVFQLIMFFLGWEQSGHEARCSFVILLKWLLNCTCHAPSLPTEVY